MCLHITRCDYISRQCLYVYTQCLDMSMFLDNVQYVNMFQCLECLDNVHTCLDKSKCLDMSSVFRHVFGIPVVLSVAWLHSLYHSDKRRCNMTFCSHNTIANGIVNGTIAFVRSTQLKWSATWLFGYVKPLTLPSAPHHADSFVNDTTACSRPGQLKWDATWHFGSCNATGTDIGSTWCQWCLHWHHSICYVKRMRNEM